ncbi:MAG: oligopeptide:H+ symporter, partial [Phycisphaerales bacterium]|nr:oligopeptide:H+ symporter [Phycisphaerales bacterium]
MSAIQTPPTTPGEINNERTLFGHPQGLFLLFLVEMWERFSYYGMRGLLVLYLITVIAVHQATPGVHTNRLDFEEIEAGTTDTVAAVQSRDLHLVVGTAASPVVDTNEPSGGTPRLVIQRAVVPAAGQDEGGVEIQTGDTGQDVVIQGPENGNDDRETRGFENTVVHYAVTNPTDAPVKVRISIHRNGEADRTYFTVNDSPESVTTEIKPDSQRGPDEDPFMLEIRANTHDSGRNWLESDAAVLYGWYTGLAYLFPILGGIIADKLIGTHRSMLIGGVLISIGHVILGISGMGEMAQNRPGLSLFIMGLAVIVLGTGHFKPTVSVMVGQLYKPGDPRRDGAFTIFYMGINLGAFICAFVCGTLGEMVGWHYGFAAAAVGMLLGLGLYLMGKPILLRDIGDPPP